MPTASESGSRKRTAVIRAAPTRLRLLEAAISCLVEFGYAGTTTLAIQHRARVSRGSLLHHYPFKDDLLSAAVQHLAARHIEQLKTRAAEALRTSPTIDEAVEFLWSNFDNDFFWATMELWIGARTNGALRASLLPGEREFAKSVREVYATVFGPEISRHPLFEEFCEILFTSMRGVALTHSFNPRPFADSSHLKMWKTMAHTYLAAEG